MCKRKNHVEIERNAAGASEDIKSEVDEQSGPNLSDGKLIAGYLAQAAAELETIARGSKLRLVAHFFAMASEEAEAQTRRAETRATLH